MGVDPTWSIKLNKYHCYAIVPTCSDVLTAGSYVASFSADGDSVEFNISVPTTGWVAIGFSPDQAMVRCLPLQSVTY